MNHNGTKEEDVEGDKTNWEERKKELHNLQDLLVQTGKEKEELSQRLINFNQKILTLEKANEKQTQETNYFKVENENSQKNLHDLDQNHITRIKELKNIKVNNEQEIRYLKSENEKVNRDIITLESAYKTQVMELKIVADQKDIEIKILNDQLRKQAMTINMTINTVEIIEQEIVNSVKDREDPDGLVCQICGLVRDTQIKLDKHMDYHNNDEEDTDRSETYEQSTSNTNDEETSQEEENLINDLITLSVGKSSGQARQSPQSQPIPKNIQHHCCSRGCCQPSFRPPPLPHRARF